MANISASIVELAPDHQTNQLTFGDGLSLSTSVGIYNYPTPSLYQMITATAGQTIFNTSIPTRPASTNNSFLMVYVNGVFQTEGTNYLVTGENQISFDYGSTVGDEIVILSRTDSWAFQTFSSTAGQTVFNTQISTISSVGTVSYMTVFVNGIFQTENVEYTITGPRQVTFTSALDLSDVVTVYGKTAFCSNMVATEGQTVCNVNIGLKSSIGNNSFIVSFVDGVYQQETTQYTITGAQVPLTEYISGEIFNIITEVANAIDNETAINNISRNIVESVSALDLESVTAQFISSITESSFATSTQSANIVTSVNCVEAITATDSSSAYNTIARSIVETASATTSQIGGSFFPDSITEVANASNTQTFIYSANANIVEGVNAQSIQQGGIHTSAWIYETAPAGDKSSITINDNEYAGTTATISISFPRNTRLIQIKFVYNASNQNASAWQEVYTAPIDKMFLNPIANAGLIASFIQNEPILTNALILRNIIDTSAAKLVVTDLD